MASLPKRSIIFDDHITGIDARPEFEDWLDFSSQLMSAVPRQTIKIIDGAITPKVADNFIDVESDTSDELFYIMTDAIHDGAILRLWAISDNIDITVKHGTNDSAICLLNGIDKKLSYNSYLELKHEGNKWIETNSVLIATESIAGVARKATASEVTSGVTATGGGGDCSCLCDTRNLTRQYSG